jgi:sn-glycerol 3-phosphate transport system permease protein
VPARPRHRVVRTLVLVGAAVLVLLPIYFTLVHSLLPGRRFLQYPPDWYPVDATLDAWGTAWRRGRFSQYLVNSAVVSGAITAGQVVTSVLAAYAFAFIRFPGRRILFGLFIACTMVPFAATLLPNYQTIVSLGWIDSYQALIVPFLAAGFGTFLLRQAFLAVPQELVDAAQLDGYGHPGILARVAVPLARPAVAALAVLSFLGAWSQYLWPLVVTDSPDHRTVQIGLQLLTEESVGAGANVVSAGALIAALPIFATLVLFQRHIVRGLTAGALKG